MNIILSFNVETLVVFFRGRKWHTSNLTMLIDSTKQKSVTSLHWQLASTRLDVL
jgi:hypothetical protein